MKKANAFIIFAILLIITAVIVKELRYGNSYHPLLSWTISGFGLGLACSALWVRQFRPKDIFPPILALTTLITIFFLGLAFLDLAYDLRKTSLAVWTWPEISATITNQSVHENMPVKTRSSTGRYAAKWDYTYELNGHQYQSNSTSAPLGYILNFTQTEQLAKQDGARRPIGSQVTAYYNPDSPEISVLDRKKYESSRAYLLVFLALSLMVMSAVGLFAVKNKIKHRN